MATSLANPRIGGRGESIKIAEATVRFNGKIS
jgi:hypothetical protein